MVRAMRTAVARRRLHGIRLALSNVPVASKVQPGELEPAPPDTFSIVVIPDTQRYRGSGSAYAHVADESTDPVTNDTFTSYIDWTLANLEAQRVAFVSHVGDLVDIYESAPQWELAHSLMDRLHGRVPYGISVGNHDMMQDGSSANFQRHFGASRFTECPWYADHYRNNMNSCQLFHACACDFVILHLECNAPDDVLEWANATLWQHRARRAIVISHMGLGPVEYVPETEAERLQWKQRHGETESGRMRWTKCHGEAGNSPQQMWDKCFALHANIFLVISGHESESQALRQSTRGDNGNIVHELMCDYSYPHEPPYDQAGWRRHRRGHDVYRVGGGVNALRVLRFVPAHDRIEVRTYDTVEGREITAGTQRVEDVAQHQFNLQYRMRDSAPRSKLGSPSWL